jgi:mono/diheme cytochrome c family protein
MKIKSILATFGAMLAFGAAGVLAAAEPGNGKALFTARCGMCHQTNGMGVGILARRVGDASKGLLEQRADLSAAVVKVVVRSGIGNMPRIARGEVSDPELGQIASYLAQGKP